MLESPAIKLHIVLHEPRIPQNTGNIGRLALATNATLHLIHPLGFVLDSRHLRRAGMDYFAQIKLFEWDNATNFFSTHSENLAHFFFSTKARKSHFEADFSGDEAFLHFGREDSGLDSALLAAFAESSYKIPMFNNARSLNLANSVSIVVYEALRQNLMC